MNSSDKEYLRLLDLILTKGKRKKNRTGVDTIGVFGAQARFDLSEGFPLLTTKKVFSKAIIHELLWFIRGETNIKYLVDNDVHIWDGDCYRKYRDTYIYDLGEDELVLQPFTRQLTKEEFISKIKTDAAFAAKWGELGQGTYGQMWRSFPYFTESDKPVCDYSLEKGSDKNLSLGVVDQLSKVIEKLKTNPDDRRMIVSAWHPYWVDHCALPPCHCLFHFNTEELTNHERTDWGNFNGKFINLDYSLSEDDLDRLNIPKRRLNCLLYQRSCDTFLGVPFNIASYALLTSMIAQVVNMVPGTFVHTYGDLHIYENHIEQCKLQLTREPKKLPTLVLNPQVDDLFEFKFEDIKIEGYDPHPAIKGEVSTG